MKTLTIVIAILAVALAGCAFSGGVQQMTPEQIKATEGMATCTQATTLYGKGASITANTDNTRKGATSKGKTMITCGDASMTIETDVGVAATPGAITTTTVPASTTTTINPPR